MFYIKQFIHKICLSPQLLGPNINGLIQKDLFSKVEGSCSAAGYVISVLRIITVSAGRIRLNGHTSFQISYEAIVLKPRVGEIVDAPIASISKLGIFASIGPFSIFISNYQIPASAMEALGAGVIIRLKIIGMKIDSNKVYAIGTLNDDCLGII